MDLAPCRCSRPSLLQDRAIIIPSVFSREDVTFLGVFDGTVGDHAADYVQTAIAESIYGSQHFRDALATAKSPSDFLSQPVIRGLHNAILEVRPVLLFSLLHAHARTWTPPSALGGDARCALLLCASRSHHRPSHRSSQGYDVTDKRLVAMCRERGLDYSACTSVTVLLSGSLLTVAHLGDSKVVLGREEGGAGAAVGTASPMSGKYLTSDHKPDHPDERRRIEASGGSLTYLHGGKPFIRGGDFTARQAVGGRPMQLNYSRAFGGKDLKGYGLIAVPDVLQIALSPVDRYVALGSSGDGKTGHMLVVALLVRLPAPTCHPFSTTHA